jgi:hypothetical protein
MGMLQCSTLLIRTRSNEKSSGAECNLAGAVNSKVVCQQEACKHDGLMGQASISTAGVARVNQQVDIVKVENKMKYINSMR